LFKGFELIWVVLEMFKLAEDKLYKGFGNIPGAVKYGKDWHFTFFGKCRSLYLYLYSKDAKEYMAINLLAYRISGDVYSLIIRDIPKEISSYAFYKDDEFVKDEYAKNTLKKRSWMEEEKKDNVVFRYPLINNEFDWEDDVYPLHDYSEVVSYMLHVRGFTMHTSSKVKHKGSFLGLIEKIDYLKELGINQIELMPAYEFDEKDLINKASSCFEKSDEAINYRVNYWGFKEGNYFMPNQAYSVKKPVEEFKRMVKLLHANGIEVIMQFYFPRSVNRNIILPVLHFWHTEYRVDGFKILGEDLPYKEIVSDMFLMDAKLYFASDSVYESLNEANVNKNIAVISRSFSDTMRKFLKGDENMLRAFAEESRSNPCQYRKINYITSYEGFTLSDLVSYDYKHNEENGECNRDGISDNNSWNCGVEGNTKKRSVVNLRTKQIKNAFCMLLLGQSFPMILAGDELLNSQNGNNNAYCQDNDITWINWNMNPKKQEMFEFVKSLISFRKEHGILHMKKEFSMLDGLSCGLPDLSLHGSEAWYPLMDNSIRHIGMMFCEKYDDIKNDGIIYIAYNMHWKENTFALPKTLKGKQWKILLSTATEKDELEENDGKIVDRIVTEGRSVVILVTV